MKNEQETVIVTRAEAQARKLVRYFDGKPCKRQHVSERYTRSRTCIECTKLYRKQSAKAIRRRYHRRRRRLKYEAERMDDLLKNGAPTAEQFWKRLRQIENEPIKDDRY